MGLEHLKSVFSDINKSTDTREDGTIFGSNFEQPTTNLSYDDISLYDFGTSIPAVDYQNTVTSGFTYTTPIPFPDGFTLNFDTPGYSFGSGELGNSKLINMTSQNYGTLNTLQTSISHPIFNTPPVSDYTHELNGLQFKPLTLSDKYGMYQSDSSLTPNSLNGFDLETFTATDTTKNYNSYDYDPRSDRTTNFEFGQNNIIFNSKNGYMGTKYDDPQTIEFSLQYGAKTFSVDRSDTIYSSVNPPASVFSYITDASSNSVINTLYDDTKSIEFSDYTREFSVGDPGISLDSDKSFNNPPISYFVKSSNAEKIDIYSENTKSKISTQFDLLYNVDHTAKQLKFDLNPTAKKENFSLRQESSRGGDEPYIVTDMGSDPVSGRSLPFSRSVTDIKRLSSYLFSVDGLKFFAKQNLLGLNSMVYFSDISKLPTFPTIPSSDAINSISDRKLYSTKQRFRSSYLPTSTLAAAARVFGYGTPNLLIPREFPLDLVSGYLPAGVNNALGIAPSYGQSVADKSQDMTFTPDQSDTVGIGDRIKNKLKAAAGIPTEVSRLGSDVLTTIPLRKGSTLKDTTPITTNNDTDANQAKASTVPDKYKDISDIETEELHGMPFYFKDLRDNTYIVFRAYLNGITEDISPEWSSENYIGRSESVHIYERADRSVTFSLKLAANTELELNYIYEKLDRLTSLCYPEYTSSPAIVGKLMMKPPLVSFRMGELFGNVKKNQTSFIKSISYTYGDNSPWETAVGKRVPKFVDATISLQILHDEVPGLSTTRNKKLNFHGFAGIKQQIKSADTTTIPANANNE